MSDDEGVTPFQVAFEAARRQVTPVPLAKRLSDLAGTSVEMDTLSGLGLRALHRPLQYLRAELSLKPDVAGAYVRQHLNLASLWEGVSGYARPANRNREIRPSGMTTGALGNVAGVRVESH